jgi:hypothetical protein
MFIDDKVDSTEDLSAKGKALSSFFTEITNAMNETFIRGEKALGPFDKLVEKLTAMQNATIGLQRSMGGAFGQMGDNVSEAAKKFEKGFQTRLNEALKEVQLFGGSFKDVTETIDGLADAMGRVVNPSKVTIENMVALAKTTGLSNKEIGGMVEKLTQFGGTQEEATKKIHDMAVAARQVGLDAAKFIKEMSANVDKVGGFGFKNGIESLTRMTKQAQMLKTTFGAIVGNLQDSVLSPEGAIEAAAKFQMLGGAVGKLADPFQLMYMAQSDMEGLQKELVKSSQAAFVFNKETGEFKASTQDLYRLKEQAAITGAKFEDLVKAGREAAKLDYIKDKFDLSGLDQENQELLAGLAQVGKDGSVTIDIPGFGEVTESMIKSGEVNEALEEYQKKAAMDEKTIALNQLTTTEKQARDVEIIRNSVVLGLKETDRENILKTLQDNQKAYADMSTELSTVVGKKVGENTSKIVGEVGDKTQKAFGEATGYGKYNDPTGVQQGKLLSAVSDIADLPNTISGNGFSAPAEDLFVPSGGRPRVLAKGKLYEGIVGDEIAMGTNLSDALNKGGGIGGKMDININLTGSIAGDPGQLNKMFNSPEVQKQIMDTVLYKMNEYKRQQGVLS